MHKFSNSRFFTCKNSLTGQNIHTYRKILEDLISWKKNKNHKPLILKGVRQVDKTYILKKFSKENFKNVHYFNFEEDKSLSNVFKDSLDPEHILTMLSISSISNIDIKKDLIIFDEIQECPKAITSLKYFEEKYESKNIIAAGSLLGLTLNNESFPVGKVEFINLYPFSFSEFLKASPNKKIFNFLNNYNFDEKIPDYIHQMIWKLYKDYLFVGGLPEVVKFYYLNLSKNLNIYDDIRKIQFNLINSYFSDIAKHSGKANSMHIERILRSVPNQLNKNQNGNSSKFIFKGVVPNIKGYHKLSNAIDWLESSQLMNKIKITKTIQTPLISGCEDNKFKLTIFDIGILGALSEIDPSIILNYNFGTFKGYLIENVIANELKILFPNYSLISWQGRTSEIEFVLSLKGKLIPIKIKSGFNTKSKSLKVYREKFKPKYDLVISAKNNVNIETNNHKIPLYLFSFYAEKILKKLN